MKYKIIHLPKEKWEGTIVLISYTTHKYYDITINKKDSGFTIYIEKKDFDKPYVFIPENCDYLISFMKSTGKKHVHQEY